MLDERGTVMYANHEFMHEVRPRCLEWKALVKMAYSIARRELMNAYGLKDRITLAVNSGSSAVTLEPVVSGSRLILVIEIHDRINVPSIIPREREINRHNITILHTPPVGDRRKSWQGWGA